MVSIAMHLYRVECNQSENLFLAIILQFFHHTFSNKSQNEDIVHELTSSITSIVQSFRTHTPFLVRSSILPGVPTSRWTGWCNRMISSLRLVPPVVTITWMFKYLESSLQTCEVWRASSRVGTRNHGCIKNKHSQDCNYICSQIQKEFLTINQHTLNNIGIWINFLKNWNAERHQSDNEYQEVGPSTLPSNLGRHWE